MGFISSNEERLKKMNLKPVSAIYIYASSPIYLFIYSTYETPQSVYRIELVLWI